MPTMTVDYASVRQILEDLTGRDVSVEPTEGITAHPATYRGLVENDNSLVSVVGSDLEFAHRSGAALAMMPIGMAEEAGGEPSELLLEVYTEVVNVLSRLVNEASPQRVRLDPNLEYSEEDLQRIVDNGTCIISCTATIAGYGRGQLGVWFSAGE